MVRPVGVNQANFGERGRFAFLLEIFAAEGDVVKIHRQAQLHAQRLKRLVIKRAKIRQNLHIVRRGVFFLQRGNLGKRSLARFHGVDVVRLNQRNIRVREVALKDVNAGVAHQRALLLGQQLNGLAA